jgi:hypothetical protein
MKNFTPITAAVLLGTMFSQTVLAAVPPAGYEDDIRLPSTNWFSDLDPNSRIGIAANFLADHGIIGGFEDGTFRKDRLVNRAEMAKFITNADPTCYVDTVTNYSRFSDVKIGEWYVPYVNAAAGCGIIEGNPDDTFAPDRPVNTVEMLAMLTRAGGFELSSGLPHSYEDVQEDQWFNQYAGVAEQREFFPERAKILEPSRSLTRGEVAYILYLILSIDEPPYPRPFPLPEKIDLSAVIKIYKWVVNMDKDQFNYRVKVYNHSRDPLAGVTIFHPDSDECKLAKNKLNCTPSTIRGSGEFSFLVKRDLRNPEDCNTKVRLMHSVFVSGEMQINTTNQPEIKIVCNKTPVPQPKKEADLGISLLPSHDTVKRGDVLTLVFAAKNDGPSIATDVVASFAYNYTNPALELVTQDSDCTADSGISAATCKLRNLKPNNKSEPFKVSYLVPENMPCGTLINGTMTIKANQKDSNYSNNTITNIKKTVVCKEYHLPLPIPPPWPLPTPLKSADLILEKAEATEAVYPGEKVEYLFKAINNGPNAATNVFSSVTYNNPQVEYVSPTQECHANTDGISVSCTHGTMLESDNILMKHIFKIPNNVPCGTLLLVNASIQSLEQNDPNIVNNRTKDIQTKVICKDAETQDPQ